MRNVAFALESEYLQERRLTDGSLILLESRVHILQHLRDARGTGKNALDVFEHDILNTDGPVLIQGTIGTDLQRGYHFLSRWIKSRIGDILDGGVGHFLFQIQLHNVGSGPELEV